MNQPDEMRLRKRAGEPKIWHLARVAVGVGRIIEKPQRKMKWTVQLGSRFQYQPDK